MERRLDDAVTFPDCNCGGDNRDRLSSPAEAAHPGQHGTTDGHLVGTGEWGKINYLGDVRVHDAEEGLIADVAVDPDGDYAYLARWGGSECAGPEAGGQTLMPVMPAVWSMVVWMHQPSTNRHSISSVSSLARGNALGVALGRMERATR